MIRQHSIIARLGPADVQSLALTSEGSQVTEIRFVDGDQRLSYGLGQLIDALVSQGLQPTETAVDLLILAAAVTAADTRISRDESKDSWTREIDLYIPVLERQIWEQQKSLLERTLAFLSGDRWSINFRERHKSYRDLVHPTTGDIDPAVFDQVNLFSGGLDSFIGSIDSLSDERKPLFVSHYWDLSTASQSICAQELEHHFDTSSRSFYRARIGFPNNLVSGSVPELTLRARSFLFLAMASVSASCHESAANIVVPENGLISLNVPLDPLRVGAWSTRTTHPFYLARMQELFDGLGIGCRIVNPYRFKTKGEMLAECSDQTFLKQNINHTISCSSVSKARWKGEPPGHCGYCVPCLIRRAATNHAFGKDLTTYTLADLHAAPINSEAAEGQHMRAFQLMGDVLQKTNNAARLLIYKTGPLSDYSDAEIDAYADVFRRGIGEVSALLDGVIVKPL